MIDGVVCTALLYYLQAADIGSADSSRLPILTSWLSMPAQCTELIPGLPSSMSILSMHNRKHVHSVESSANGRTHVFQASCMATSRKAWLRPTVAPTLPRPVGRLLSGWLWAMFSGAGTEEGLAAWRAGERRPMAEALKQATSPFGRQTQ